MFELDGDIAWDEWRAEYDALSYEEQKAFYNLCYNLYPSQEHHDAEEVDRFLRNTVGGDVVELGGWTGELAKKMLAIHPDILTWTNVEICENAAFASVVEDDRYNVWIPNDYIWNKGPIEGDIFIAAHVIEHMKSYHLAALIKQLRTKYVYFEAPLLPPNSTWNGMTGNHILELRWSQVHLLMDQSGYRNTYFTTTDKYGGTGYAFYKRVAL
jgi:hypothetical protein